MSIVAISVRYAGFHVFRPSCICCANVVSSVVVEWCAQKPCCEYHRGLCGVMFVRAKLSSILMGLLSSVTGLQAAGSVGSFVWSEVGYYFICFPDVERVRGECRERFR